MLYGQILKGSKNHANHAIVNISTVLKDTSLGLLENIRSINIRGTSTNPLFITVKTFRSIGNEKSFLRNAYLLNNNWNYYSPIVSIEFIDVGWGKTTLLGTKLL